MRPPTPHMISPARRLLSSSCFALGTLWGLAGGFRYIFGIRISLWGLPPFGLEHISAAPALMLGLGLVAVGAFLGRDTTPSHAAISDPLLTALPLADPDLRVSYRPSTVRQPNERRS